MPTFLFDDIIIGPIRSRRLGTSLGVNLLKPSAKLCNFDCIYCECGWNADGRGGAFNDPAEVAAKLEAKLREMSGKGEQPDVITFAGNGEPTMHPQFAAIIDKTIELRDRYAPASRIAVLSNATMIDRPDVREALLKVDQNILKFDSALNATVELINQPQRKRPVEETIGLLKAFAGRLIVQTMLLRGSWRGVSIDNTTEAELAPYLAALQEIAPAQVMLYTLDRCTPASGLEKVTLREMKAVAARIEALGIPASVAE